MSFFGLSFLLIILKWSADKDIQEKETQENINNKGRISCINEINK